MKNKKFVLNTKKPLGNPNGIKVLVIITLLTATVIEYNVIFKAIRDQNFELLIYPLFLVILPFIYPIWKWLEYHTWNWHIYKSLMDIAHSENLIDYSSSKETTILNQRQIEYGVKIIVEQKDNSTIIIFYPNGIKNADKVRNLDKRLEESFNKTVLLKDSGLSYTKYILKDLDSQRKEVSANEF